MRRLSVVVAEGTLGMSLLFWLKSSRWDRGAVAVQGSVPGAVACRRASEYPRTEVAALHRPSPCSSAL